MAQKITQKTAQQIVDTVKDVCGHNINFIDENGIIFVSTDASRIGTFHEIGKQVIITGETIEVTDKDSYYGTHPGVNIPINHQGKIFAVIGISGPPNEVRKYAYLAQKITVLLLREHDMDSQTNNQRNKLNYIIRSLVSGENTNPKYLEDYIKEHGLKSNISYITILVKLDSRYNPDNISMIEQKIYQTFEKMESTLYTFSYPNEYILLLEAENYKYKKHLLEKLAESYKLILKIAIGAPHPLMQQNSSYREAEIAINSPSVSALIASYNELGIELLYGKMDKELKKRFLERTLSALSDEEVQLLTLYYAEDMSLSRTCEKLFLHKNTVQYQLDRIYKKSGYNPRNFKDAVVLYSALIIQKDK